MNQNPPDHWRGPAGPPQGDPQSQQRPYGAFGYVHLFQIASFSCDLHSESSILQFTHSEPLFAMNIHPSLISHYSHTHFRAVRPALPKASTSYPLHLLPIINIIPNLQQVIACPSPI